MSAVAGVGGTSVVLALVASLGGFGCICNVAASHRCGGEEDPYLDPSPSPLFDAGSGDPDASDASDSGK